MPAVALTSEDEPLGRFFVIGERYGLDGFVHHVALHADTTEITHGQAVDVVHMGPPLDTSGTMNAHVAGNVPLTLGEVAEMEVWIAKIEDEYEHAHAGKFHQYVIHPTSEDFRDPITGVRRYRRFSCAGFVLDAHRHVEIDLLDLDETVLPEVSEDTIVSAYPWVARLSLERRARLGLRGDGPWRVVLAGYVLHSLNRSSDNIRAEPYQARPSDSHF